MLLAWLVSKRDFLLGLFAGWIILFAIEEIFHYQKALQITV